MSCGGLTHVIICARQNGLIWNKFPGQTGEFGFSWQALVRMDTRYTPETDTGSEDLRVLIRPNRSLSPWGMVVLFMGMAAFALIIGIGFSLVGAWLVLPFAGLEMAVVGTALYWLYRHAEDHDLVVVGVDRVRVIRHRAGRDWQDEFQRYWVRVTLERHRWYPSRLKIGSHGRFVVVGADVNEEERRALSARLNEALRSTAN
jgi:uncharacterized membrane protein